MDKALASGACDVSSILAGGANIKYDLNDMSTPDSNIDGVFAKNLFSAKDFSGEPKVSVAEGTEKLASWIKENKDRKSVV